MQLFTSYCKLWLHSPSTYTKVPFTENSAIWLEGFKLFSDDLWIFHINYDHLLVTHGELLLVAGQAVHILKTTWKADCKNIKIKTINIKIISDNCQRFWVFVCLCVSRIIGE